MGVHETRDGGGVGEGGVVEELLPPAGVMGTQQKPGSKYRKNVMDITISKYINNKLNFFCMIDIKPS